MTKKLRHERSAHKDNTYAGNVYQRQLPLRGLKCLIENVREQKCDLDETFIAVIKNAPYLPLEKERYELFMQTLFASLYVFSPQGRVGGIADLTCKQGLEMIKRGNAMSRAFKTNSTFGYQPVTIADSSRDLVEFYITHVRPMVAGVPTESNPSAPLWLLFNGNRATNTNISQRVTR